MNFKGGGLYNTRREAWWEIWLLLQNYLCLIYIHCCCQNIDGTLSYLFIIQSLGAVFIEPLLNYSYRSCIYLHWTHRGCIDLHWTTLIGAVYISIELYSYRSCIYLHWTHRGCIYIHWTTLIGAVYISVEPIGAVYISIKPIGAVYISIKLLL